MAASRQIPFDLGHRTAMGRDDFLIAPNNQDAVAWIDAWPDWPAPALILYGPVASGKSHLAAVWGEKSNAACVHPGTLNDMSIRQIASAAKHVILEDADMLIGNIEAEKGLFHLYNLFKEEKRSIMLTLLEPPIRRSFALPDLASRLRAAPAVAIREPDDVLLSAILVKMFNDRQLRVGQDVINYIVLHMERSFEEARRIVEMADNRALIEKRGITVPMMRGVLQDLGIAAPQDYNR
ncbi:MAG: DNA replication protein [Micavibrio aeruginosavorus]|uniref:DNA replication protein n=1 Tax=Micavibrio aeruginosavorus TaxID=349221 RepID=A0A2W5PY48_9BACT|nr:MAG: DNA replication protein [Micavibrio aeruginosavorus]